MTLPSKGPWLNESRNRWCVTGRSGQPIPWARVVFENAFRGGEELPTESLIHHRDGDSVNDALVNLECISKGEHGVRHRARPVILRRNEEEHQFRSLADAARFLNVSSGRICSWASGYRTSKDGWIVSYV